MPWSWARRALGMIFWPQSPRAARSSRPRRSERSHRRVELAGVFVNATLDEVATTADAASRSFSCMATRGRPTARRPRGTGCRVIKAARVHDAAQVQALRAYATDFHLLDAHSPWQPGGTGESFDWDLACPHRARRR